MASDFVVEASSAFRPKQFKIDPQKTALLVVDMQNEFCSVGGEGTLLGFDMTKVNRDLVPPLQKLLEVARSIGIKVVYTRAGHRPDLADAPKLLIDKHREAGIEIGSPAPNGGRSHIRGTWNHQIIEELPMQPGDVAIDGSGYNKFYQTELDPILRNNGIDTLIITGVNTDVCVSSTTRYAADIGYKCLIPKDCVSAFVKASGEGELKTLEYVFAATTTSDKIIEAIQKVPAPSLG